MKRLKDSAYKHSNFYSMDDDHYNYIKNNNLWYRLLNFFEKIQQKIRRNYGNR